MAGDKAAGGTNVGAIWYEIAVDTKALIDAERQAEKSTGKMATSLTAVAEASKMHATAAGLAATAVREASKANEAAAASATKAADAAGKAAKASQEQAISAKQLSAAMRNVPAQVTDIVAGLATGQSPLTVLLQQGGQLKDMFGGVGNAARALGTYIAGLLTPITAVVGAVGALALGWLKGREEMGEFNRTLAMTGNQSGVTAQELNGMAASLGNLSGITRSQAAGALNTFVQAGVEGEAKLRKFTEAAIRLEQAGGQAVEKTAKAFADLEKDPLTASLRLNDATNYLTESVYRQIKSLVEQGRTVEAATVAQNAYADAVLQRTPKVEENLGLIEKAWKAVGRAAKGAWAAVLNVGRQETPEQLIAKTRAEIERLEKALASGGFATTAGGAAVGGGLSGRDRRKLEADLAAEKEKLLTLNRTALVQREVASTEAMRKNTVEALAQFDKAGEKFLTDRVRMEREIAQAKELGRQAGASDLEIQQRIAAIRKSYEKGGGSAREPKELGSARDFINGLSAKVASEWDRIDIIEQQSLKDAEAKLRARNATAMELEEARTLILQKGIQARAELLLKERAAEEADAKKKAEAEIKAELDKKRARDAAFGILGDGDPFVKAEQDAQKKSEMLAAALQRDYITEQEYAALKVALEQNTAERIRQIREQQIAAQAAQQSAQMQAYSQLFDGIAGLTATFAGKQSGIYKAMFAASKAFAIADSIVKIQNGLSNAASLPFPKNIAAMGTVAAATAGIVSTIRGTNYGGGRQYGGPVDAGSMYRVGEGNRPEMFVGDSGRSFMIPGERGKVVSNSDMLAAHGESGAAAAVNVKFEVEVNNYADGARVQQRQERSQQPSGDILQRLVIDIVSDDMAGGGKLARATQNRFNLRA